MDFSCAAAALMASGGSATSISFFAITCRETRAATNRPVSDLSLPDRTNHPVNRLGQPRQFPVDDTPDYFEVDSEVAVDDHVAKTRDRAPRNVGFGGLNTVTQPLRGLSDGMQVTKDGVLHEVRLIEDGSVIAGVFADAGDAGTDVFQQGQIDVHGLR